MSKKHSPQRGTYEDYLSGNIAGKNFTFRLINRRVNSTMTTSRGKLIEFPLHHNIEAFSVIVEKGRQRVARFIPGESSIYKDEQTDDKDVPKKKYNLQFVRGLKIVSGDNDGMLLLDYMFKDNLNGSNKNRRTDTQALYEFVDIQKIIKSSIEQDDLKYETIKFCREADFSSIKMVARVMNVNMNQSAEEIRYDLRQLAEHMDRVKPGSFMEVAKSSSMKTKHYVMEAIEEGILVTNRMTNSIAWATNPHQPLDTAAMGKDIVDSFVQKLSTAEGKLVYDTIVDMLTPDKPAAKMSIPSRDEQETLKAIANPVAPTLVAPDETDDELLVLLDRALELGVVTFIKPLWYKFSANGYEKNNKKKEGFIDNLKNDQEFYKAFKIELGKRD